MNSLLMYCAVIFVICGIAGMVLGIEKVGARETGRLEAAALGGLMAGLLMGPLGLILVALMPRTALREARRQQAIELARRGLADAAW